MRLARIETELDAAAEAFNMLAEDTLDGMFAAADAEQRFILLVAITGATLLSLNISPTLVQSWMAAMALRDNLAEADRLGTKIIEQMMLHHAPTLGKG